jgi:hypothetical protein
MGSATTPPSKLTVTSVRIEQDDLDRFKLVAAAQQRTVSQQLRYMIRQANTTFEREKAA